MSRLISCLLLLMWLALLPSQYVKADINSDILAACTTGGSITIPPTLTVVATINLKCPGAVPSRPVRLVGSPSLITCQTGATPCVVVGSTNTGQRANLSMNNIYLDGPGRAVAGSVGIRILATADESMFGDIRVENFDKGIHFTATGSDLFYAAYLTHVLVGTSGLPSTPSVNTAVHLEGAVANVKFTQFHFAGWQRLILIDGQGLTGADATFSDGDLNTTKTAGVAAVSVSTSDASGHVLNMSNIQDWETQTPYLEVGERAFVTIDGIGFSGDPYASPGRPAFKMLATNTFGRLTISDSWLYAESDGSKLVSVEGANNILKIIGSHIQGTVQFLAAGKASLVGNHCDFPVSGTMTNVRMVGNTGACPDN
jgi:hypothetical protein